MSKNILFVLLLAILVFVGGFYFLNNGSSTDQIQSEEISQIYLYKEEGEVSIRTPSDTSFKTLLSASTTIPNKTVVQTGKGRALVILPDNSTISLEESTQIVVNYTETKTSIYQVFGFTYHRVESLINGSSYEVETPGTLAAVRGTKFGVFYDKEKEETKISVTENKVAVSKLLRATSTATSTEEIRIIETILIDTGKTVKSDTKRETKLAVDSTEKDKDMKVRVGKQKDADDILKKRKEEIKDEIEKKVEEKIIERKDIDKKVKENFRKEIKKVILNEEDISLETEKVENVTPKIEKETIAPVVNTTVKTVPTEEPENFIIINKLGEEEFFNRFNDMFIKFFYLDDSNTPCLQKELPLERVNLVSGFAKQSGYPFTSETLLPFAKSIGEFCVSKDASLKTKLQIRFDEEFPYKEDI